MRFSCRLVVLLYACSAVTPTAKPLAAGEIRYRLTDPDVIRACSVMRGVLRRRLENRRDGVRRVDDRRYPGLLVTDQVRRTSEVVVQELLEEHDL